MVIIIKSHSPRQELFEPMWGGMSFGILVLTLYTWWNWFLVLLKAFDGKQLCIGRAWLIMKILKWHVLSLWDPLFELPSNLANVIEDQFYQRWKMLTTDLHYARALLNPYLLGEICLHDDANAKKMLNRVLRKTIHNPTAYALALRDFTDFVESSRPFFNTPLMKGLKLLPHEWWNLIGVGGCTFTPITCCILA